MSAADLPDFLIIGAQKSATRWLRINIGAHPEVHAISREVRFFDGYYARGARWYADQFQPGVGERLSGEATPGYMFWRQNPELIAARIDGLLPNVRLIAVLRDPVTRAASAFRHHVAAGRLDPSTSIRDHVTGTDPREDPLGIISGGWYGASLEPYVRWMGDRLALFSHDQVKSAPHQLYRDALEHIGAEDLRWSPRSISEVRFSNVAPAGSAGSNRADLPDDPALGWMREFFVHDLELLEARTSFDVRPWLSDVAVWDGEAATERTADAHSPDVLEAFRWGARERAQLDGWQPGSAHPDGMPVAGAASNEGEALLQRRSVRAAIVVSDVLRSGRSRLRRWFRSRAARSHVRRGRASPKPEFRPTAGEPDEELRA